MRDFLSGLLKDLRKIIWIGDLLVFNLYGEIVGLLVIIPIICYFAMKLLGFTIFSRLGIIVSLCVEIIRLLFLVYKNNYIKCKIDDKINIIIAIDSGLCYEWFLLKRDFIGELEGNIDKNKFRIKLLPQKYFDKLYIKPKQRLLDKEYITKLNEKINGNYRICGKVEKQKDDGIKCYIETVPLMFPKSVGNMTERVLNIELGRVYEQVFSFLEDKYKTGIKFSGEYSAVVAQYIIGLACLASNDISTAWELHKDLYEEANKIKEGVTKGTSKDENIFRSMIEIIKGVQWMELKCLTILSYNVRFDEDEFSEQYKSRESWLMEWKCWTDEWKSLSLKYWGNNYSVLWEIYVNNAIYEFVANRNTELSRGLFKKVKSFYKAFDYSIIFLDLYSKKYEWAKNRMKKLINKTNDKLPDFSFHEIIRFIDIVLDEDEGHEELLYWQAMIFYKKLGMPLYASERLHEYLEWSKGEPKEYEIIPALELQKEIDKTIPIEDENFTYNK